MNKPILFFDGVCGLCNGFVDFVFRWDKEQKFNVASLQGKTAIERLPQEYILDLDTFVLLKDGEILDRSTAVLTVLRELPFPWPIIYGFIIVPKFLRDAFYRVISKNRYLIFGKKETCRLPAPDERSRFLD